MSDVDKGVGAVSSSLGGGYFNSTFGGELYRQFREYEIYEKLEKIIDVLDDVYKTLSSILDKRFI